MTAPSLAVALALALPTLSTLLAAQLAVQSAAPNGNATAVAPTIRIGFATALDPLTVTPASVRVWGRWSGAARGSLTLTGAGRTIEFTPARPFFAGEMVTVLLSSTVASTGGSRLLAGYTWSFWTEARRGTRTLQLAANLPIRRAGETFIQTYGAYAGDLDHDGAPDFSLPNETSSDVRVLRNDGCGGFAAPVVYPLAPNGRPSTNEGQDYDGDGHTDLAVGNITAGTLTILMGNGSGGYRPAVHYRSGDGTRGLAVLDLEADGDIDVVTANRVSSNLAVHRNNGNGTFAPATFLDGGGAQETALAAADADHDGIADLFVGCYGSRTVTLLRGDGAGNFTLSASVPITGQPWMIATADVDGDGHVDAVTCNSSGNNIAIVRGNGLGGLLPAVHLGVGSFPLAIDLGDLDGDGAHDIVASNYSSANFSVLWNNGNGTFGAPVTLAALQAGSCALLVDYDRDGDVDMVGVDELQDRALFFRHVETAPPNVALATCGATLRLDEHAGNAGFGARAARGLDAGRTLFVGVSGTPGQAFGVLGGVGLEPGAATPFGLFNLASAPLLPLGGSALDAAGEAMLGVPLPAGLPAGARLALQGAVVDPSAPGGLRLTNAEIGEVR